jgi:folate-binding protein YgfZ
VLTAQEGITSEHLAFSNGKTLLLKLPRLALWLNAKCCLLNAAPKLLRYNQKIDMTLVAQREQDVSAPSDSRRKMTALLGGCGIYKLDHALISLTGRDRVRWLNGMVSNNVRDLPVGHGVYAFVLNAQGQIQGDLYVFNRGESLVVEIERAQVETLLPLLRRYIIMDKVELEDLSEKLAIIGLAGPKSREMLEALGLRAELAPLQFTEKQWNGTQITLMRGDNPCVPNYTLWVPKEHTQSLWSALLAANAQEVDDDALETFRILCGIPKIGLDIRERMLPQETGQERALSFTKGCYIGQEIVERIRARGAVHRAFVGFEVEGPSPSSGMKIQYEGKDVGEITSVASAPLKQKRLALGYLRKDAMLPNRKFVAGHATVKPVSLPFSGIFD